MAGLEQLHMQNYQDMLPEAAKMAMLPTNAWASGVQQSNFERSQDNILQMQQDQLAESGLNAAVSNAQNNPQGVATLAGGEQGVAQTKAAKGQVDQAEAFSKISQADIDKTVSAFDKYHVKAQSNPMLAAAGSSWIDDPEVKAAVESYAHTTGKTVLDSLNDISENLGSFKLKHAEQESMAKSAGDIAKAKITADAKITYGQEKNAASIDAAKIRAAAAEAKQSLASSSDPKALDSAFLREISKISAVRAKAIADTTMTPELETALNAQELELRRDYETIRAKYKNATPSVASTQPAAPVAPKVIQYDSKGNRVQ